MLVGGHSGAPELDSSRTPVKVYHRPPVETVESLTFHFLVAWRVLVLFYAGAVLSTRLTHSTMAVALDEDGALGPELGAIIVDTYVGHTDEFGRCEAIHTCSYE